MLADKRFVIFASGEGSNAKELIHRAKENNYTCVAVISDRSAPVLEMAAQLGVPSRLIHPTNESSLLEFLKAQKPDWAFLAGYKKILKQPVLDFFWDKDKDFFRIVNVHPSLLPAYPGLGGYEKAFGDGVKVSGVTVHLVDAGLDTGLPILQESFYRTNEDTLESFVQKGKQIEHKIFPMALDLALKNKLRIEKTKNSKFVFVEDQWL